MKVGKKHLLILSVAAVVVAFLTIHGCKKSDSAGAKSGAAYAASVDLCTYCGQIKGSESCCKPDQPKCDGCGLVKGSPGCCNIPEGAEKVALCTKCGQIKGTELCCKPDQAKCTGCGLVKGSPGCCKIPKQQS
jgi:hypothetical protein